MFCGSTFFADGRVEECARTVGGGVGSGTRGTGHLTSSMTGGGAGLGVDGTEGSAAGCGGVAGLV